MHLKGRLTFFFYLSLSVKTAKKIIITIIIFIIIVIFVAIIIIFIIIVIIKVIGIAIGIAILPQSCAITRRFRPDRRLPCR